MLPERVAMTSPSSGVNPIVVSTDAAVADRAQRGAGAEVAADHGGPRRAPASSAARWDVGMRQAVEPVPPEVPALHSRGRA